MNCKSLFLLFLVVPFVAADVVLKEDLKQTYNLGDAIRPTFEVSSDKEISSLFKLGVSCDSFSLDYFVTLIDLMANETVTVSPPRLKPIDKMKGKCKLTASLNTIDNVNINTFESGQFEVKDVVNVDLTVDKPLLFPGETVKVAGAIDTSHEDKDIYTVVLSFDGRQENIQTENGAFSKEINIEERIKSGKHTIGVSVSDPFGNHGENWVDLEIKPKLKRLSMELNKASFLPEEELSIKTLAFDQMDEPLIMQGITLSISKSGSNIFSREVASSTTISYPLLKHASPGSYVVKASYETVDFQRTITVEELMKLDAELKGESLTILNSGNVQFNNDVIIRLTGTREYELKKSILLNPSEQLTIDLSKEIAGGTYDIDFIFSGKTIPVAKGVTIEDKRPILSKITGAFGVGPQKNKPKTGLVLIALLIIALVAIQFLRRKRH